MEKAGKIIETICTKIVFLIAAGMFGCLIFWAGKYSHRYAEDLSSERVLGTFDSMGENVFVFLILLVILYLLQLLLRGTPEAQKKRVRLFLILDMIVCGIWGIVWVSGCHIAPSDDQLQVYLTAVEFTQGIYRDMEAYFKMCPQQYGLAFLYECVLWIWESYHLIQYINVLFLVMILFFGYKISDLLFENPRINLYTVLAMNLFLPLMFYVNFVYGEVGTVAMSMCSVWAVLQWMKTGRKRNVVTALLCMSLAVLARLNMIIVAAALAIVLVVSALKNKNWKACIVAALLFIVPLGSIEIVEWTYELRSGIEVGDGIPVSVNVAMGMQQSWQGAGAYNAYNHQTFWNAGGDTAAAAEIGKEYIRGRLQEFANDLPTARYFYQSKIWEQWDVGSFGSLIMTSDFEEKPFAPAQSVYAGKLQPIVQDWMEWYLFCIYAGAFLYSLHGILFEKELKKTLLPMVAIGGMIFSLLWESKARYVFPYVTMLLPAAAVGFYICQRGIEKIVKGVKNKIWTK